MFEKKVVDRFWSKVLFSQAGCWEWTGCKSKKGYGQVRIKGKAIRAHRFAWEYMNGSIPAGLVIDHIVCDNTSCVRPDHLQPCTNLENILRKGHWRQRITHCPQGHPYKGDNLRVNRAGSRVCCECRRIQGLSWYHKNKAKVSL